MSSTSNPTHIYIVIAYEFLFECNICILIITYEFWFEFDIYIYCYCSWVSVRVWYLLLILLLIYGWETDKYQKMIVMTGKERTRYACHKSWFTFTTIIFDPYFSITLCLYSLCLWGLGWIYSSLCVTLEILGVNYVIIRLLFQLSSYLSYIYRICVT